MSIVPEPHPEEFRDVVVNVARNRDMDQHLKQIAADFGISESCSRNWMKAADVDDGVEPGTPAAENADLREARKRIRLLEQEKRCCRGADSPDNSPTHAIRDLAFCRSEQRIRDRQSEAAGRAHAGPVESRKEAGQRRRPSPCGTDGLRRTASTARGGSADSRTTRQ